MDYKKFYAELCRPVESEFGPIDPETIFAIIGFDFGGPLNFCTAPTPKAKFVTYISCELAVRREQVPSSQGHFELMCHCNDEKWVRNVLTTIGQMSLESRFDHLHTIDISQIVRKNANLQGAVLERYATVPNRSSKI
jgi:hypothetical protein